MRARRSLGTAAAAATLLVCAPAAAGGIDSLPDQGAQALGRGATFTARADDATALYYNVAGLARQRGTKLQLSANLHFNSMTFQRAGEYPDDPKDPSTPWGGTKYPLVSDANKSFTLPMLVASSDFGYFDRLTFGLGVFGPAATGRTFPLGIGGMPSPSRYDFIQSKSTLLFATVGAAYRVTEHIDVGLSVALALASANELTNAYADPGGGTCKNPEYRPCDAEGKFTGKGGALAGSIGAMFRPIEAVQVGLQVRSPVSVPIEGETIAKLAGKFGDPSKASTEIKLPLFIRAGGRYITMVRTKTGAKRELWDAELDLTYEGWAAAQGTGPTVKTEILGKPATITSTHHYNDTFSIRVGGAYNFPLGEDDNVDHGILTLRAGTFYDAAATDPAYTRLDTNTLAKIAGTAGVGYKYGAFMVNAAYAAVFSPSRTVTDGKIRPNNGAKDGRQVDGNDQPLPAINNGEYTAFTHVLSIGVEVNFEALFHERKPTFGDPEYEDLAREGGAPPPKPKAEGDEPKPAGAEPAPTAAPPRAPGQAPFGWWNPRQPDDQLQTMAPEKPAPSEDEEEEEEEAPTAPPKKPPKKPRRPPKR